MGKLDQKKCELVIYILTTFNFKFEAIMVDIGKQENGNFKFTILGEDLAQNWENTPYFEFGKGPLFGLGKSLTFVFTTRAKMENFCFVAIN